MDPIVPLNKKFLLSLVNHNDGLGTVSHSFTFLLGNRGASRDSSAFSPVYCPRPKKIVNAVNLFEHFYCKRRWIPQGPTHRID